MTIGIEHVNDYPLIRFEIRLEIRFERKFPISRSLLFGFQLHAILIALVCVNTCVGLTPTPAVTTTTTTTTGLIEIFQYSSFTDQALSKTKAKTKNEISNETTTQGTEYNIKMIQITKRNIQAENPVIIVIQ